MKTGRIAQHFKCSSCGIETTAKDIEVDHIKPIVDPVKGFQSWDMFIDKLFCESTNLQAICKSCHKIKTASEKVTRNENRQKT